MTAQLHPWDAPMMLADEACAGRDRRDLHLFIMRSGITLWCALLVSLHAIAQDGSSHRALGDSLMAAGRSSRAIPHYDAAIAEAPTAENLARRANAWLQMERLDKFLVDVEEALRLDSSHVQANHMRALFAYRAEDRHGALRLATRGLNAGATGEDRAKLLRVRGMALTDLRREKEAVVDLREGLQGAATDLEAMKAYARALDATGDHAGSLAVAERLCELEPKDIGNWINRGYELAQLGRHEEAVAIYGKAFEIDKDEPTARSNRAWSFLQLGRENEALADVERSLRAYPSNAFALRTRAMIRLRRGQREKACNDLSLARVLGNVADVDRLLKEHCEGGAPPADR